MNYSIINNFLSLKKYKIALIVCADDGYINNHLATTAIKSFLFHNRWFNGDIVFFDDKKFFTISEENKNLLKSIYNKVIFKEIDYSKYKDIIDSFINITNNTKNFVKAYPKFEIFDLLDEYDKILCIDGDILFVDNVKDLFEQDIALGVTSSMLFNYYYNTQYFEYTIYDKDEESILIDSGGFNSGVLYLGNKKLKNITSLIIDYIKNDILKKYNTSNKKIMFFDQCILCYFFNENFKNLVTIIKPTYNLVVAHYEWNNYKLYYNIIDNECIKNMFENAKILHYIHKPYNMKDALNLKRLWNFYNEIPIVIVNNKLRH